MKRPPCDKLWQVEAARDGRLDASLQAAFNTHLAGCSICRAEQAALASLADALRASTPEVNEVSLRRLRRLTLEQASQALFEAGPERRPLRSLVTGTVALAIAAASLAFLLAPESPPPASAALHQPVQVLVEHEATWRRSRERDIERVELSSGTLLFRVKRRVSDPRLVVVVPDGEIEDLGTTFRVSVRDGKTSEIEVSEGRVAFHRRGESPLHVLAGSTWTAPAAAPTLVPSAQPVPEQALEPARESSPAAPAAGPSTPAAGPSTKVQTRRPSRTVTAPASDASRVAATDSDAREDAAYLHVLALLREGRSDEARLAAFGYLREFPNGFRRVEVQRVIGP